MQGFIIPLSRTLGARTKTSSRSLTLLVYPPPPTTPAALRCCAHRFPAGFVPLGQKPFDVFHARPGLEPAFVHRHSSISTRSFCVAQARTETRGGAVQPDILDAKELDTVQSIVDRQQVSFRDLRPRLVRDRFGCDAHGLIPRPRLVTTPHVAAADGAVAHPTDLPSDDVLSDDPIGRVSSARTHEASSVRQKEIQAPGGPSPLPPPPPHPLP